MPDGVEVVEQMLAKVSNWGRWGTDDHLGTLNLLSEDHTRAALRLPSLGRIVQCGRSLVPPAGRRGVTGVMHHMLSVGADSDRYGASVLADWFGIQPHGTTITHLDALNHLSWKGKLYNGVPAEVVTATRGGAFGSAERVSAGVVTRGILLDVPLALGVEWVDPGAPITAEQLEAAERMAGVTVGEGDALIVRTGRDARQRARPTGPTGDDALAGLHIDCVPWSRERGIVFLGSEAVHDVVPPIYAGLGTPVHVLTLVGLGLWLIDNLAVDALAATCRETRRWEFQFVLAPIAFKNSTGVPVNPLAVF